MTLHSFPAPSPATEYVPEQMTFSGASGGVSRWTYHFDGGWLTRVDPPEGPPWSYTAGGGVDMQVTTPHGGVIAYDYEMLPVSTTEFTGEPNTFDYTKVITRRRVSGRELAEGEWSYHYEPGHVSTHTEIEAPDRTRTVYDYGPGAPPSQTHVLPLAFLGRQWNLVHRAVLTPDGDELEDETREYTYVPLADPLVGSGAAAVAELTRRVIRRGGPGGRTFTTEYSYNDANLGDYHHPYQILERQGALLRTTRRTFEYGFTPFVVGKVATETVTVGGESFQKSWSYDRATGFVTAATAYGITTAFTPTRGNVLTATRGNGHATTFAYAWGVVRQIATAAYTVNRTINPEGTVAAETRAGRTTSFTYDKLFRIKVTRPPSATLITTSYSTDGQSVTVSRGGGGTTTTLDGLGRAIATENSVHIRTLINYDVFGRKTFESYPYTGTDPSGTAIGYDDLGRVVYRSHPDASAVRYAYDDAAGTVTLTDEIGRETVQTLQAFGNPDEARLTGLRDAANNSWSYTYNAIGALTSVAGPPGPNGESIDRTWEYLVVSGLRTPLLAGETHPESGRTDYLSYDGAGNLTQKRDAKGTTFSYAYDDNDRLSTVHVGGRVTRLAYEPGFDNLRSAAGGLVTTTFSYDAAGHLASRVDNIAGRSFTRLFQYDGMEALVRLTYPSGRIVRYEYDTENRIARVYDQGSGANYASAFSYHPSGPSPRSPPATTSSTRSSSTRSATGRSRSRQGTCCSCPIASTTVSATSCASTMPARTGRRCFNTMRSIGCRRPRPLGGTAQPATSTMRTAIDCRRAEPATPTSQARCG